MTPGGVRAFKVPASHIPPHFASAGYAARIAKRLRRPLTEVGTVPTDPQYVSLIAGGTSTPQYSRIQDGASGTLATVSGVADGIASGNSLASEAFLMGWNGATFDRLRANWNDADGQAIINAGVLVTRGQNWLFNSASWDRWKSLNALAVTGLSGAGIGAMGIYSYNGATFDALRSGDVNNVAAATGYLNVLGTGRYNATLPTLTDTRYNALQVGARGSLHVELFANDSVGNLTAQNLADGGTGATSLATGLIGWNGTTWDRLRSQATNSDSLSVQASGGLLTLALNMGFNGTSYDRLAAVASTTDAQAGSGNGNLAVVGRNYQWDERGSAWDRMRANIDVQLLASASRTTTQTSADLINYNGQALIVVLDMTTVGTASVTVSIDMKDTTSGKYINLLTGAAITTNSTNRYRVGPTLAAVANSVGQDYMPRVFRIVVTANNANAGTYSVGYHLTMRS